MKTLRLLALLWLAVTGLGAARAQGNLEINTPAIAAIRTAMQARHGQLAAHYASGAIGVARDGRIELLDANAIALRERQAVTGLVAAENGDRAALYREIARANGHPEWEADIRATFATRWIERAQPGWWVQTTAGQWVRK